MQTLLQCADGLTSHASTNENVLLIVGSTLIKYMEYFILSVHREMKRCDSKGRQLHICTY